MAREMSAKLLSIYFLITSGVRTEESTVDHRNSTEIPVDNSFNFDEFDQNGQNKVIRK